jgi:hypothetical protein
LNKQQFRETLLEFLSDVTNIPEKVKSTFINWDKAWVPNKAPDGFMVLTDFLLVKDRSKELNEKYWLTTHFYTETHRYHISACLHKDDSTYLGAIASTRKPRAGEDWTRGNDLPDGDFSQETWNKIKNAIIRYELERLSDYIAKGHWNEPEAQVEAPSLPA